MFFKKKRKLSGEEIAERTKQDYDKQKWLRKVLSFDEFHDFLLAKQTSMFYNLILEDKEPTRNRSKNAKQLIRSFRNEVEQIIRLHKKAALAERDQQVEQLIRDADFSDRHRYIAELYYHFRPFTDAEKSAWHDRFEKLSKEFFGIED